ncbi:protein of unknown function [Burkholderia multivorans]
MHHFGRFRPTAFISPTACPLLVLRRRKGLRSIAARGAAEASEVARNDDESNRNGGARAANEMGREIG